jgi:hypothetical protein
VIASEHLPNPVLAWFSSAENLAEYLAADRRRRVAAYCIAQRSRIGQVVAVIATHDTPEAAAEASRLADLRDKMNLKAYNRTARQKDTDVL